MGETIPLQRKPPDPATLRGLVFATTGYDVRRCGRCSYCVKHARPTEEDLSLEMLVQMILENDEEVSDQQDVVVGPGAQERTQHVHQHDGHAGHHANAARRSP